MVRDALSFVILSSGRVGSAYVAQVLRDNGIWCGHELYCESRGINWAEYMWDLFPFYQGESSWMALPMLHSPMFKPARKLHLVRDPLLCIPSHTTAGLFRLPDSEPTKFALTHCPEVAEIHDNPELQQIVFYLRWNRRIEEVTAKNYRRHRIEDPIQQFFEKLGLPPPRVLKPYKHFHGTGTTVPLDLDTVPEPYREELRVLRSDYGYGT